MWRCLSFGVLLALLFSAPWSFAAEPAIYDAAGTLPVAAEVDVVVVGGSTGAVAAAVAAAETGADVFLIAGYPYLGEDMTATLRLWLEEGEEPVSPLGCRLFDDPKRHEHQPSANRIPYTYQVDAPTNPVHPDTTPPTLLVDGRWQVASKESVQFDGDVTIQADLGKSHALAGIRLIAFYRGNNTGGTNFIVESVAVSTSPDAETWTKVGTAENTRTIDPSTLSLEFDATARFVRFEVKKSANAERILLGEIEILKPEDTAATAATIAAAKATPLPPRPMHIKKTLDDVLLEAGVRYLYNCQPTDVLRDAAGRPAGIVMANRSGRQAVLARTIIDATGRGVVARMAGAEARPWPGGEQSLSRVVIGGEPVEGEGMTWRLPCRPFPGPYPNPAKTASGLFQVIEYTLTLPVEHDAPADWSAADQLARTKTYHEEQQFTADAFFQVPPDPIIGREQSTGAWESLETLPLDAFRPRDVEHLLVLGPAADVSRVQAEVLTRPLNLIDLGTRLGVAAVREGKKRPELGEVGLHKTETSRATPLTTETMEVREFLTGIRPVETPKTVEREARELPVLGRYDVVVVGGGTGGAPAAISAARQGAKTLLIEYLHGLGGVGTDGAISKYYWGNRVGFTATIPGGTSWVIEQKKEWYRRQVLDAGGDIWFSTMGCGAIVQDDTVRGVIVATPQGRGVVLAGAVIDATGNSDIAAAAGAGTYYTDATEFGMQGTGLPPRLLGATYTNTDFTIADETDLVDVWHLLVYSKNKYAGAFDHGKLIDTRERRRIVGDFTITLSDQVLGRTHPDTIEMAYSNFDSHGYTIDPYLEIEHPEKGGFRISVPYRCLLPRGLEGILVIGLGISAHRDAVPMTRMQPDIQNQGYAAGVAASMAAKAGSPLREIDLRKLQEHLIDVGNLPESVLTDTDSFPLSEDAIRKAVQTLPEGHGAAAVLTHAELSLPLLRIAYDEAEGDAKLLYAQTLAVMGDPTGVETLIAEVEKAEAWDVGWNYRGMGQFGSALSPLDRYIMALGRAGDKRAVPAITRKADLLTAESEFSHHRAVGLGLELLGEPSAAKSLAELLLKPDMTGYVHATLEVARQRDAESPGGTNAVKTRRESLRELVLARALFRLGDYGNIGGQILDAYTHDLRGHLARHAKAVLAE